MEGQAAGVNVSHADKHNQHLMEGCGGSESEFGKDSSEAAKKIKDIMPAPRPHWVGNGFHVYPVFSSLAFTDQVSPFLMFDYGAPEKFDPTNKRLGVGKHPHRGMETVTIAWQGEVEHGDSVGNRGVIGPGDVQWMTAGRGIVHEEYHSRAFARTGGVLEMCQLWVNLPKKNKMAAPGYQPILKEDIPQVPLFPDDAQMRHGHVRIIAGSYAGSNGPANTFTPINVWDMLLITAGKSLVVRVPAGHHTLNCVRKGALRVAGGLVGPQGMVRLESDGTLIALEAEEPQTQLLLLGGEPIREPIAAAGPFVMNTRAELAQAQADYHSGKLGQ
jgi:redox-sensitive bicupin YhaK (pirin superfamily)